MGRREDGYSIRQALDRLGRDDGRTNPMRGSNGSLDILTPFWEHPMYRRQSEEGLERLRERGVLDESDPARPRLKRMCAGGCGVEQLLDLFTGESLEDGELYVSGFVIRLAAMFTCAACEKRQVEAVAETRAANTYEKRLQASGMSPALRESVAGGWDDVIVKGADADDTVRRTRARDALRAWAESEDPGARGVWLSGGAGGGKTHLLALAALERMRVVPVRWVSVAVLVTELEMAWADEDRQAALKVITDPGVVVLDDLDKVPPSQRAHLALFTALDKRDQAGSGVCVSSNAPPGQISKIFSTPFMSRLVKLAHPLPYPGADRRVEMVT